MAKDFEKEWHIANSERAALKTENELLKNGNVDAALLELAEAREVLAIYKRGDVPSAVAELVEAQFYIGRLKNALEDRTMDRDRLQAEIVKLKTRLSKLAGLVGV